MHAVDRRIRGALMIDGAVRAVVSLRPELVVHYALALQILVLRRPEPDQLHSHVLLVDTSGLSTRTAQDADSISGTPLQTQPDVSEDVDRLRLGDEGERVELFRLATPRRSAPLSADCQSGAADTGNDPNDDGRSVGDLGFRSCAEKCRWGGVC